MRADHALLEKHVSRHTDNLISVVNGSSRPVHILRFVQRFGHLFDNSDAQQQITGRQPDEFKSEGQSGSTALLRRINRPKTVPKRYQESGMLALWFRFVSN